jgi:CheY-like chemotaxis protein
MATILIVDDDQDIRASIRPLLEADKHRVVEAADGTEAMHCWRSLTLDVIITDFAMPRMNGQEVIQAVAAQQPAFPIILMSCGIEEQVLLCILHHFPSVRYLPKQLVHAHLRAYVRDALTPHPRH